MFRKSLKCRAILELRSASLCTITMSTTQQLNYWEEFCHFGYKDGQQELYQVSPLCTTDSIKLPHCSLPLLVPWGLGALEGQLWFGSFLKLCNKRAEKGEPSRGVFVLL